MPSRPDRSYLSGVTARSGGPHRASPQSRGQRRAACPDPDLPGSLLPLRRRRPDRVPSWQLHPLRHLPDGLQGHRRDRLGRRHPQRDRDRQTRL